MRPAFPKDKVGSGPPAPITFEVCVVLDVIFFPDHCHFPPHPAIPIEVLGVKAMSDVNQHLGQGQKSLP